MTALGAVVPGCCAVLEPKDSKFQGSQALFPRSRSRDQGDACWPCLRDPGYDSRGRSARVLQHTVLGLPWRCSLVQPHAPGSSDH